MVPPFFGILRIALPEKMLIGIRIDITEQIVMIIQNRRMVKQLQWDYCIRPVAAFLHHFFFFKVIKQNTHQQAIQVRPNSLNTKKKKKILIISITQSIPYSSDDFFIIYQ